MTETEISAVHGRATVESVSLLDRRDGSTEQVPATAVFVMIGADPCTEPARSLLALDAAGYLLCGTGVANCQGHLRWPLDGSRALPARDDPARACSRPVTCAPTPPSASRARWATARSWCASPTRSWPAENADGTGAGRHLDDVSPDRGGSRRGGGQARRGARLRRVLARRFAAPAERAPAAGGDRGARDRHEHRQHLGLRPGTSSPPSTRRSSATFPGACWWASGSAIPRRRATIRGRSRRCARSWTVSTPREPPLPRDRRCLAALAPKMLALSAERSLGAIPYFVPVEHTSVARAQLGAGPLLAPELACVLDTRRRARPRDRARVRAPLPRAEQLHEQPARARLQRARTSPVTAPTA